VHIKLSTSIHSNPLLVSNIIALHLFTLVPLGTIFSPTLVHWMNTIYAVALIQNTLTTGLVAYRLWCQEMSTRAVGFLSSKSERSSLMPIVWIIIESAAIYVLELVVLLILYSLKHNAQFIVQEAVVPTVGKCFKLSTSLHTKLKKTPSNKIYLINSRYRLHINDHPIRNENKQTSHDDTTNSRRK